MADTDGCDGVRSFLSFFSSFFFMLLISRRDLLVVRPVCCAKIKVPTCALWIRFERSTFWFSLSLRVLLTKHGAREGFFHIYTIQKAAPNLVNHISLDMGQKSFDLWTQNHFTFLVCAESGIAGWLVWVLHSWATMTMAGSLHECVDLCESAVCWPTGPVQSR